MKSLSTVGLGLSVVFGCLLFALVAEIYYLLWWKRRLVIGRELEDDYTNPARQTLYIFFCWKTQKKNPPVLNPRQEGMPGNQLARHSSEAGFDQLKLKPLDENGSGVVDPSAGFPRFLFTIKEETKEDLESEDGKSRIESRRLCDLFKSSAQSPPFLTPISSPTAAFFTPPITPTPSMASTCHSHSNSNSSAGYNPFFESSSHLEFTRMRSSPPPKFKFLRDAEEKLQRRTSTEEAQRGSSGSRSASSSCCNSSNTTNVNNTPELQHKSVVEEDGSFIRIVVAGNNREVISKLPVSHSFHSPLQGFSSSSSSSQQVFPLASSTYPLPPLEPSRFRKS